MAEARFSRGVFPQAGYTRRRMLGAGLVKIVGKLAAAKLCGDGPETNAGRVIDMEGRAARGWGRGGEDECLYNATLLSAFPGAKSARH